MKTTRTRLSSCGVEKDWIPACAGMTSEAGVTENGGSKQQRRKVNRIVANALV
ncbi:hypothetical protein [Calycomorphotria hydatis]|uniref:Uncharacterized protein n=1 Tax=Calycomorphotria hydatis TaxID=2528027 RepID=A0A517T4R1_9PLAN|nr:hypothetical protein [Calycomorphotria hydatis]QDT63354.1 hypothetical protein V22_05750 [Calycomorphotria hydatis]